MVLIKLEQIKQYCYVCGGLETGTTRKFCKNCGANLIKVKSRQQTGDSKTLEYKLVLNEKLF